MQVKVLHMYFDTSVEESCVGRTSQIINMPVLDVIVTVTLSDQKIITKNLPGFTLTQ